MAQYIDKDALVAEIKKLKNSHDNWSFMGKYFHKEYENLLSFIDTLEVVDPYEQCIQYASIEGGIKSQAEDYSFNIESELFNQLTKEQQTLWRKEIEQACISGGYTGYLLARDSRYKENLKVKEVQEEPVELKDVDLEKEIQAFAYLELESLKIYDDNVGISITMHQLYQCAKHFFKLGLSVSNKTQKG